MSGCLFCNMASGQINVSKIYEDEKVLAFHDISPKAPVHFLVIPKEHIAGVGDIDSSNSSVVSHIFEVIAKLADELHLEKGFRVVTNCGKDGGQTIGHLHYHVLGGRQLEWPPG